MLWAWYAFRAICSPPQLVEPRFQLVRSIQPQGIRGEEGRDRHVPGPVVGEAVHGIELAPLHGVEHLEGPDDRGLRKGLELELPLRDLLHVRAVLLERLVACCLRLPGRLDAPLNECLGAD